MKCKLPIEPVAFSRRLCQDASTVGHGGAQARYLNRLTPVSVIVKATDSGLEEGARQVLADHFKLKPKEKASASADPRAPDDNSEAKEGALNENTTPPTVGSCMYTYTPSQTADLFTVRHPAFDPQSQHSQEGPCHQTDCQFGRSPAQSESWSPGQGYLDRHISGQFTAIQLMIPRSS